MPIPDLSLVHVAPRSVRLLGMLSEGHPSEPGHESDGEENHPITLVRPIIGYRPIIDARIDSPKDDSGFGAGWPGVSRLVLPGADEGCRAFGIELWVQSFGRQV